MKREIGFARSHTKSARGVENPRAAEREAGIDEETGMTHTLVTTDLMTVPIMDLVAELDRRERIALRLAITEALGPVSDTDADTFTEDTSARGATTSEHGASVSHTRPDRRAAPAARVLVVANGEHAPWRARRRLEGSGFNVSTTGGGVQALLAAHDDPPDLIVLDHVVGWFDTRCMLTALKRDARTAGIPIVLTAPSPIDGGLSIACRALGVMSPMQPPDARLATLRAPLRTPAIRHPARRKRTRAEHGHCGDERGVVPMGSWRRAAGGKRRSL